MHSTKPQSLISKTKVLRVEDQEVFSKMPEKKHRNTRSMNKEENTALPKEHINTSSLEGKDKGVYEMPEKEFKRIITRSLKNTEKQVQE